MAMMRAFARALVKEVAKKLLRPVIDDVLTERLMDQPKLFAVVCRTTNATAGWWISTLFERRADAERFLHDVKWLSDEYKLIEVADIRKSW